ncbi:MAG: nickel-dependent lactate racemase [Christensenellaceae bacterium]|jgi:hypothetical protein|nr:nickel-dependent lactate racemase [Christensenellaceae bacterium]
MRLSEVPLHRVKLRQLSAPLGDIPQKLRAEFSLSVAPKLRPGMRIALALGSRGINNLALIAQTLVGLLREAGTSCFIVPAMGSHGGATPEGQRAVLADYGITEEKIGAPVLSSLEVVSLGSTGGNPDIPVFIDKAAFGADGVIAVNRIKPHTDFHGEHESGIVKMLTIGLGKHRQAIQMHTYGASGLRDYIPRVSQKVIESVKILSCLAVLEDGYDQTADLAFASGDEIFALDKAFLARSRQMMAKLPFEQLDVLVVDEMGKDLSGTGMDTNVIGRLRIDGQADGLPKVGAIAVLGLTPASHGNALGVGLADVCTRRLAEQIDWSATYQNVVTSGFLARGFLPVVRDDDKSAIELAIASSGARNPAALRLARIRNTLHLDEILVSQPLLDELLQSGRGERL